MTDPKRNAEDKAGLRKPRHPGNPTDGHRQELDDKRGSRTEGDDKQDRFSGEKTPKH